MKIGTTIRGYRLQKGLSQGDIEKRTGLLRCYLSRVENGHTVPSLDTLAKIASALELPLAQLFAEDTLGRQFQTQKLSDDELRFLTQIRRYSTNLNDSDRKLLLAMVKKFATTAARSLNFLPCPARSPRAGVLRCARIAAPFRAGMNPERKDAALPSSQPVSHPFSIWSRPF